MSKSEHDQMLGRENPLEFWLQEANRLSNPAINITPNEAMAVIKHAFSSDWLDEIITAPEKGTAIQSSRHPLAGLILLTGKKQIQRVLELGLCLRELHAVHNLALVIQQMKGAEDFESTWIQMAYGYRLHKIGATELKFEPDVDNNRKADILFKFQSQLYLVECFMPHIGESWQIGFAARWQKQIFDFTDELKKVVCVKVFLQEDPPFTHEEQRSFEKEWKQLVRQVADFTPVKFESVRFAIQVQEISHLNQGNREALFQKMFNEDGCLFAWKKSMMDKSDALNTMRGQGKRTHARDLVFFHTDKEEESMDDLINRLSSKMEKKVNQLKLQNEEARGILVVSTPLIHPNNSATGKQFERLRGKVIEAHPHVDAVIMIHPQEGPSGDPRFGGTVIESTKIPIRTDLLAKLEELEMKGPLL